MRVLFFFFFIPAFCLSLFERRCSASWLNCARVRNLFQFKQDALIAEAQSQITSIHSSESWLIGVHGVKRPGSFIKMPNVCNKSDTLSHHEQVRRIYSCGFSVWLLSHSFLVWFVLHFMLTTVVFVCLHLAVTGYNGNERIWAIGLFPSLK